MFCRNCGKEITAAANYCPSCGARPSNGKGYCFNCGQATNPAAVICVKCGVSLEAAGAAVSGGKSKIVAGILGILVGEFGVHRFYLGYIGIGIVQIVVTIVTFGIGGLWGFIEGILLLVGTFNRDAKGNPLTDQ
jgi:TM2 domain-containing membrane protein YozV